MDLSKAHDCLPHDLLIAKLGACGLDRSRLRLLMDYLNFRKQRTKVGSSYSIWSEIKHGRFHTGTLIIQYTYRKV